jgi:UDP-N-acetyl-D-galactosamine dehydrogenase
MSEKIAVIGLGYVGLPLAVSLAKKFNVTGFDVNISRINELQKNHDRTAEIELDVLQASTLKVSYDPTLLAHHHIYIVTVPTPVDHNNKPDFTALLSASETVGQVMSQGAIVVFESTVYPGVTEDICGPALEKASGLVCGKDFYLGYSPERINPGDREHTVEKITKVVAGQTPEVTQKLAQLYGTLNQNNIFIAANIKTAEAAKVIENTQRDINIAFMNEIAMIFNKIDISVYDVLAAAGTKWNFLPFSPGLVGGHCIGVDPYYLAECAKKNGQNPEIILAGRRINDSMADFVANQIHEQLNTILAYGQPANVLVLGLTFKENVPDLRNSKVINLIQRLQAYGHHVAVHDPLADVKEAHDLYDVSLLSSWEDVMKCSDLIPVSNGTSALKPSPSIAPYDCVIGAVPHTAYKSFTPEIFSQLVKPGGIVVDLKKTWKCDILPAELRYWTL